MKVLFLFFLLLFFGVFSLRGEVFRIGETDFAYRIPKHFSKSAGIMVLFGGRNWDGGKTLRKYRFEELADKHGLFLLSPSFRADRYWEPESGSGAVLEKAVAHLEKRFGLGRKNLYLYGYSAGGQCANLFYAYMPDRVAAWGAHACGVYFRKTVRNPAPALITCGTEDRERFEISRNFLYSYRESGGELLWKYDSGGHELTEKNLELARAWFDALLSGERGREKGEDDTGQVGNGIEREFQNPLYNRKIRDLWKQ